MYKTKLTKYGYTLNKNDLTEKEIKNIKKELTSRPFKFTKYEMYKPDNIMESYSESKNHLYLPKFYGIEKFGKPQKDCLENYPYKKADMKFLGSLRKNQPTAVSNVINGIDKYGGGLLIAGCGCGKTVMSVYIACHYGLKTLFIAHKSDLIEQFHNTVKKFTNIDHVDTLDKETGSPFVTGTVIKIANGNYSTEQLQEFGMIIIDEIHHMGAKLFSQAFKQITSKYIFGITATTERADKSFRCVKYYTGNVLHFEEQKPNDMVIIKRINYKTSNIRRTEVVKNKNGSDNRSLMVTNLVHIRKRNRLIMNIIVELYKMGRNVLFLSSRIKQIDKLFDKLLPNAGIDKNDIGKYIGGMKDEEKQISSKCRIILGSDVMADEGLDIPGLDALILASPKSKVKQPVGRILRKDIYDIHPLVIDIVDLDVPNFLKQSRKRNTYYNSQKYNIHEINISDYKLKDYFKYNDTTELCNFLNRTDTNRIKCMDIYLDYNNPDNIIMLDDDSE